MAILLYNYSVEGIEMKLIEKKCPNCGANLEFSDTDKSCKCSHCNSAFEIERELEQNNNVNLDQQFILNEMPKGLRFIPILFVFIFIVATSTIGFVIYNLYQDQKFVRDEFESFDNELDNEINNDSDEVNQLFTDASELENADFESLDNDAIFAISNIILLYCVFDSKCCLYSI